MDDLETRAAAFENAQVCASHEALEEHLDNTRALRTPSRGARRAFTPGWALSSPIPQGNEKCWSALVLTSTP